MRVAFALRSTEIYPAFFDLFFPVFAFNLIFHIVAEVFFNSRFDIEAYLTSRMLIEAYLTSRGLLDIEAYLSVL